MAHVNRQNQRVWTRHGVGRNTVASGTKI